jgi:hypothetical protein
MAVGVGALVLVDQNQLLVIKEWLRVVRLDPQNRFIHWLLTSILLVTNEMLEASSIGSFVYGGLALVQGGVSGSLNLGPPFSPSSWLVHSSHGNCIACSTR